jgi:Uma2 family endonuclease
MGTTTAKFSFEEFQKLQDAAEETVRYELDEGELIVTPSPTPRHNLISFRLRRVLAAFVEKHRLGVVTGEVDFRLSLNTVCKPDVAFIAKNQMKGFDPDRSPVQGAPTLAVEVISPGNPAGRTLKKVRQYLAAGTQSVWLIYPKLKVIEIHERDGIRRVTEQDDFSETRLFSGSEFSLSLPALFDDNPER